MLLDTLKNNLPETHETKVVGSTNVKLWKPSATGD